MATSELFSPTVIDLKIGGKEIHIDLEAMKTEEVAVFMLIYNNPRITQRQISNSEQWLGCHPKFEIGVVYNPDETTLRRVRAIIRTLRLKYKCPILSDSKGYWIPTTEQEVADCMERLEQTARAQAKAWMITFFELSSVFNAKSDYFDIQRSLFGEEELEEIASQGEATNPKPMKKEDEEEKPAPIAVGDTVRYTQSAFKSIAFVADKEEHVVEAINKNIAVLSGEFSRQVHLTWLEKVPK